MKETYKIFGQIFLSMAGILMMLLNLWGGTLEYEWRITFTIFSICVWLSGVCLLFLVYRKYDRNNVGMVPRLR